MNHEVLHQLAQRAGLSVYWRDYRGETCEVPAENLRRILEALGYVCATPEQQRESLQRIEEEESGGHLPPLITADLHQPLRLGHGIKPGTRFELQREDGERELLTVEAGPDGAVLPGIGVPGYHRLQGEQESTTIAVAPGAAYGIHDAAPGRRPWGLAVQLYALRYAGDGGVGDFRALAQFARSAAGQGADAVAISPVHALFGGDPQHYGPYAPSSRLFLNALYADLRQFGVDPGGDEALQQELRRLEGLQLIDWPAAARARYAQLRAVFQQLQARLSADSRDPLAAEFATFVQEGGDVLMRHARFEVLHAHQFAGGRWHWQHWPEPLRRPENPEVAEFADQHQDELRFQLFVQFAARRSLAAAQRAARDAGMHIGLVGDLAVGTDSGGSHAWSRQDQMLRGLTVGAPPDLLAGLGQNWGLTAFSPRALREEGFQPFLEMLRANLRDVGGLRIDHVLGLHRLWLVPEGANASDGCYLSYPLQDLLRLIALESWRAKAVIVGEDLGTVPEGFRDHLERMGILGMRVLWFERDHGYFVEPPRWQRLAMATTSTHDLPTTAGWWKGRDLDWRAKLRQFPADRGEAEERAQRDEDRRALWNAFCYAGLAGGEPPPPEQPEPVIDAAVRFVARTPCVLAMVPVEDIVGIDEQPNLPGTTDEHPNWQRRLPMPVDEVLSSDVAQRRLSDLRNDRSSA